MALRRMGMLAESHWRNHRPKMVAHLEALGLMDKALELVQERVEEMMVEAHCDRGLSHDQAREIATQKLIYLPSEEEMETLPADLMPFSQPKYKNGE